METDQTGVPLPDLAQEVTHRDWRGRDFRELSEAGLLWLINAVVFHPRGFALALCMDRASGKVTGWDILGDGTEPWQYAEDMHERFARAESTLANYRYRPLTVPEPDADERAPERDPDEWLLADWTDLVLALGGSHDSYTGLLLRLVSKADPGNHGRLRLAHPRLVRGWELWMQFAPAITAGQLHARLEQEGLGRAD